MIRIIDDYVVTADALSYALCKESKSVKEDGEERVSYRQLGYFTSLRKAVEYCRQDYIRRQLQEGERTLSDAVQCIRECDNTFKEVLERCLPE